MKEPLVSIVIPTFNRAHYLGETLDSIVSQTFKNWECLIIDDGSTDTTVSLVEKYLKIDKRFSYYQRPDHLPKGANSCRNYGFTLINGDFIKWFDSDDIMMPTHMEELINLILAKDLDFAVADSVNFNDITKDLKGKPYNFSRDKFKITANSFATQKIGWITDDFLGRKSSIKDLRFNVEILTDGDEYNFFTRYLLNSNKGLFLNKILTKRRIHEDSLSNPGKYNEIQMYFKVSKLKLLTYKDIRCTNNQYLKRWFLKGFMLNSYYLSLHSELPFKLNKGLLFIAKEYSILKAFAFSLSLLFGLTVKKGYSLLKYARE